MVESYIQSKMEDYLIKMKMESAQRTDFFGDFAVNPNKFEFSIGERVLIHEITNHVNQTIKKPGVSISYFYNRGGGNYDDADDLSWYPTANGYFFTKTRQATSAQIFSQKDKSNEQDKLFKQAQEKLSEILKSPVKVKQFKKDSIKIKMKNDIVQAAIVCWLCDGTNEIKISTKRSRNKKKHNWVLSNFLTHMKRCHSSNIVEESERLNKNRNVGKLNTEEKTISQIDSKSDIKNTSCSDLEESEHVNKNRNDRKLKYSERKSSQSIIHLQDDFEIDISCPIDSKLAHNSTTTGDIVHTEDILSSNEDISEISSPNSSS